MGQQTSPAPRRRRSDDTPPLVKADELAAAAREFSTGAREPGGTAVRLTDAAALVEEFLASPLFSEDDTRLQAFAKSAVEKLTVETVAALKEGLQRVRQNIAENAVLPRDLPACLETLGRTLKLLAAATGDDSGAVLPDRFKPPETVAELDRRIAEAQRRGLTGPTSTQ